jgi:thioredoxin 1
MNIATKKFFKPVLALALCGLASLAMAGEIKPFDQASFDKLAAEGRPVVLDVSASWCPTCKQQKPIVDGLMKQPAYKDVTTLVIDYDTNKALLKKLKVTMQSTLLAFKGSQEVARSVGDTTAEGIEGLIKKTVN